jgi:hypothetical protein
MKVKITAFISCLISITVVPHAQKPHGRRSKIDANDVGPDLIDEE